VPDDEQRARRSPYARVAGSRLFIDVTALFVAPRLRSAYLAVLSHVYRDVALGIESLCKREEFRDDPWAIADIVSATAALAGPVVLRAPGLLATGDPADNAREAEQILDELVLGAKARISSAPEGSERVRRIAHEFNSFFVRARPALSRVITGIVAHRALTRLARGSWAKDVRDELEHLLRGLPGNVTTEMDLAVGDLSDRARESEAVAALLSAVDRPYPALRRELERCDGGPAFLLALDRFIERYGDRGVAEIDVSRPRWRDDPSLLLRVIAGGLAQSRERGAHRRHHAQQVAIGERAVERLAQAANSGPGGGARSRLVRRLATVARTGMALREHPKFAIVRTLGLVRETLIRAGETLVERGQLDRAEDVFHLDIDELASAMDDRSTALRSKVAQRRAQLEADRHKRPPFVLSSDGETPVLELDRTGLSERALVGTAASAGVIEGIARVIRDPNREVLQSGEILVAECTDPGWTPLFVHAAGVVTEVGGLMTHGAVVAREYGIPAVVSVREATTKIATGQRVRVDGTRGVVEPLEDER
jgi:pyruvate,water dikinase